LGPLDTEAPLTGDHGYSEYNGDHADTPRLHAYATLSHISRLDLFLLWWPFLDIENVLLEPVARRQDGLPPLPPTPGPPSKTIPKRDAR
jgi:hypothetical protein